MHYAMRWFWVWFNPEEESINRLRGGYHKNIERNLVSRISQTFTNRGYKQSYRGYKKWHKVKRG